MKTKVAIVALGIATVVPWTVGEKAIFLVAIAVAYVVAEELISLWAIRRDAMLLKQPIKYTICLRNKKAPLNRGAKNNI